MAHRKISLQFFGWLFCILPLWVVAAALVNETVLLNGKSYEVPKYWAGKRIDITKQPTFNSLAVLPSQLTLNQSRIYVTKQTKQALLKMVSQAQQEGVPLSIDSGFRSEQYQKKILEKYLNQNMDYLGLLQVVAPPGYSQHMLGNCVDFVPSELDFSKSAQYVWLKKNAQQYGFIESYSENNTSGINWEPWHWQFKIEN
jgi:D-alanyl-D-alanine carboxypeptidase